MNIEFVFVVFCLTIITIVAIVYEKDRIAEIAIGAVSNLHQGIKGLLDSLRRDQSSE